MHCFHRPLRAISSMSLKTVLLAMGLLSRSHAFVGVLASERVRFANRRARVTRVLWMFSHVEPRNKTGVETRGRR